MLGVASVLGGFPSPTACAGADGPLREGGRHRQAERAPVRTCPDGTQRALPPRTSACGTTTRSKAGMATSSVNGISVQARARVRSDFADQERDVTASAPTSSPSTATRSRRAATSRAGPRVRRARRAARRRAVATFFPDGHAVGQTLTSAMRRHGDRRPSRAVFRFRDGQHNIFGWRNRLIGLPTEPGRRPVEGYEYHRLDRMTFRVRTSTRWPTSRGSGLDAERESPPAGGLPARRRRRPRAQQLSQGDIYDIIFMLSGVLALIGGGMVNVNIQLASLKERVREVGIKMAIGAPGARFSRRS